MPQLNSALEIILGNSNSRFSGVTSTMLQVLPYQAKNHDVFVLGAHNMPKDVNVVSFFEAIRMFRKKHGVPVRRVFHARRNDEMIQALILKYIFGCEFKMVFTSTAQRKKTWLTRWLMNRMDGLITTCTAAAKYMEKDADVIIPHGVDYDFFAKGEKVTRLANDSKYSIGIFGRVREQKGINLFIDSLINVLPEYPEWSGVIVGEITPDNESFVNTLKRRLESVGLSERIRFTGKVSFEQLPNYFQGVDIICALSVNEGFGLTVLEGMAAGKPVVATRAGAWPDIINKDVGRLIDVGDKAECVRALQELMSSDDEREKMGAEGKLLINNKFRAEHEAQALVAFYDKIVSSREKRN